MSAFPTAAMTESAEHPDPEETAVKNETEQHATTVYSLTNGLCDAVRALAEHLLRHPDEVSRLAPSGIEAIDVTLRQAAMVLFGLAMASKVRTDGFDFDPTPSTEASDRFIELAHRHATAM